MKLKRIFSRHKTGALVIKRRISPRLKLFIVSLGAVLLLVAIGAVYNYGLSTAGVDSLALFQQKSALRDDIKRLSDENRDLRETLARAQRALQMDQVAYQEIDRSLKDSAREINRLKEELSFYRNIISPSNKAGGLQVERLNVERVGNPADNVYRYKLVLIQSLKHEHTIYGRMRLEVAGAQDGKDTVLNFPGASERQHSLNFKYFQEFEGTMKLPRNFQPGGIKVSITTTSPSAQTLEQNYAWPKL
jgi:hypothetical protein